ncbi:signal transduction histidine kinase [Pseudoclavibacter sp. JAI123]|uniref:sensor histidine kinase n=1 Tax=Pseudoclavibacter sp. JAI123 TaxID=2723065 RepID=UPI0015CE6A29|nr:histidine kinase [Pseudoclavibacter sp. JAI123]NYF13934.1 signal transduction histidine kinase [Pseudoclavibacter sp. JAI123]
MTEPGGTLAAAKTRIRHLDEDTTSTVVVVTIAVVLALFDSAEQLGPTLVAIAIGAAALTQKRRFPVAVLTVCVALAALTLVVGGALGVIVLVLDALYVVGRFASRGALRVVEWVVVAAVLAAFVAPLLLGATLREAVFFCLQALAIFCTPLWWAGSVRQSAELARVQEARADDAERLLVLEREEAVRAERERMARDLHDVVAANLSAIAITSEAALAGPAIAPREAGALQAIRASALEGLDEMRSMILILRHGESDSQELAAPPRLAQVAQIVADTRAVDVTVVGEVPSASAASEQALARVVAEALANSERHSPGADVEVRFEEDTESISVLVTSVGGTLVDGAPGTGNGLGLIRERAERLGGRLEAGPIAGGGGWRVSARVPRNVGGAERGAGRRTERAS